MFRRRSLPHPRSIVVLFALAGCSGLRLEARTMELPAPASQVVAAELDADPSHEILALLDDGTLVVWRMNSDDLTSVELGNEDTVVALDAVLPAPGIALLHQPGDRLSWLGRASGEHTLELHGRTPVETLGATPPRRFAAPLHSGSQAAVLLGGDPLRLTMARPGQPKSSRAVLLTPAPRFPVALEVVDLDRDGAMDFVVGMATGDHDDPVPDHVRVYRSHPGSTLADEAWVRVPAPVTLASGDVDGDSWPDLAVFGPRGAWILQNLGHGWLGPPTRIATGHFVDGALVDLDGNGRADMIALDDRRAELVARRSLGRGAPPAWGPKATLDIGDDPRALTPVWDDAEGWILVVRHAAPMLTLVSAGPDGAAGRPHRRTNTPD